MTAHAIAIAGTERYAGWRWIADAVELNRHKKCGELNIYFSPSAGDKKKQDTCDIHQTPSRSLHCRSYGVSRIRVNIMWYYTV